MLNLCKFSFIKLKLFSIHLRKRDSVEKFKQTH